MFIYVIVDKNDTKTQVNQWGKSCNHNKMKTWTIKTSRSSVVRRIWQSYCPQTSQCRCSWGFLWGLWSSLTEIQDWGGSLFKRVVFTGKLSCGRGSHFAPGSGDRKRSQETMWTLWPVEPILSIPTGCCKPGTQWGSREEEYVDFFFPWELLNLWYKLSFLMSYVPLTKYTLTGHRVHLPRLNRDFLIYSKIPLTCIYLKSSTKNAT